MTSIFTMTETEGCGVVSQSHLMPMMNNHLVAWSVCFEIKGNIRMKLKKNCYLLCGAILFYTYSNCAQISNVGAKAYRYLHIYSEDIMSAEEMKIHIYLDNDHCIL